MTFLCGPELAADVPHTEFAPGQHGWPMPWALRCNSCLATFEYGSLHADGGDVHTCRSCREGKVSQGQLAMDMAS